MRVIDDNFDWEAYEIADEKPKVIPASSVLEQVLASMFDLAPSAQGAFFPWDKFQAHGLRIRPGEVSIYAGINGHYKSQTTSQIALGLMAQGEPCLIASFEMPVHETMKRMTVQAAANSDPTMDYVKRFHTWTDDRLWLYNHHGTQKGRKVIAVCQYAASELGIKHVFIDSLMKCVRETDDYTAQKTFVEDLCTIAMRNNVHAHLVHHAKKKGAETDIIDKFDIKGAGEIVDQAHNAFLIQKNIRKAGKAESVDDDSPEVFFTVCKQRNGPYEGTMGMWRHGDSLSLVEKQGAKPLGLMLANVVARQHSTALELEREPGSDG